MNSAIFHSFSIGLVDISPWQGEFCLVSPQTTVSLLIKMKSSLDSCQNPWQIILAISFLVAQFGFIPSCLLSNCIYRRITKVNIHLLLNTGFHVARAGLEVVMQPRINLNFFLLLPPECQDFRPVPPYQVLGFIVV